MQALQAYLDRMGSNFLVAAMVPSLGFVTACMLVFEPSFPESVVNKLQGTFNPLIQGGLIILILTIVIGFTLSSLNTFFYKVFEGYILIWRIRSLRRSELRKARHIQDERSRISNRIERLRRIGGTRVEKMRDKLRAKDRTLAAYYDANFPFSKDEIMPSRFGNILKAAELYPMSRYGMDGVTLWPRLVYVIPKKYFLHIDQSSNQVSFLMNCAILSSCFSVLCALAVLYQFCLIFLARNGHDTLFYFAPIQYPSYVYIQRAILYFGIVVIGILVAIVFHRAALVCVSEYGSLVKSTFDLFRFDLLAQLKMEMPKNLNAEINTWEKISEYMTIGNIYRNLKPFTYILESRKAKEGRRK